MVGFFLDEKFFLCLIVRNKKIKTKVKGKTMNTQQHNILGTAPDNKMANQNGLDEIDKWAANVGNHQRRIKKLVIQRKGKKQV